MLSSSAYPIGRDTRGRIAAAMVMSAVFVGRAGRGSRRDWPAPLEAAALLPVLEQIVHEAGTITLGRPRVRDDIRAQGDQSFSGDQARWSAAGSNPRATFQAACWELDPGEALIVEVDSVPESSFWVVVAHDDPGFANWLDPAGRRRRTLMWRWNYPPPPPIPRMRRVPVCESARCEARPRRLGRVTSGSQPGVDSNHSYDSNHS